MATPWFDIRDFANEGMKIDGSSDWTAAFERAIQHVTTLGLADDPVQRPVRDRPPWGSPRSPLPGTPGGNAGTLYLPAGTYPITRPLVIAIQDGQGYRPCSLSIVGEPRTHRLPRWPASCIVANYAPRLDRPAIIIQGGATVRLRNLLILGQNHWIDDEVFDPAELAVHYREDPRQGIDPYVDHPSVRQAGASPYSGICIDPFDKDIPEAERYPDLSARYAAGPRSRDIAIEGCDIRGFLVGVCVAPLGDRTADAPRGPAVDLSLTSSRISVAKTCLSIGGRRQVVLNSVGLGFAKYGVNCIDHGGPGDCPSMFGVRAAGLKHLFLTASHGGTAVLSGLDVRDTLSLGWLGERLRLPFPIPQQGDPPPDTYQFSACTFSLANPADLGPPQPALDAHLFNYANTSFTGCSFTPAKADPEAMDPPIHLFNDGRLVFDHCQLGGDRARTVPEAGASFWITGATERVSYHHSATTDRRPDGTKRQATLSALLRVDRLEGDDFRLAQTTWGALCGVVNPFHDALTGAGADPGLRWVSIQRPRIPLGTYGRADLALQADGRLLFAAPAGIVRAGDLILAEADLPPSLNDVPPLLGRVDNVLANIFGTASDLITLRHVPIGLRQTLGAPGRVMALSLVHFPRIHPPTLGTVAPGASGVSAVKVTGALGAAWAVGDRIAGQGIQPGTYVTKVEPGALTLSRSAGGFAGETELYDADIYTVSLAPL